MLPRSDNDNDEAAELAALGGLSTDDCLGPKTIASSDDKSTHVIYVASARDSGPLVVSSVTDWVSKQNGGHSAKTAFSFVNTTAEAEKGSSDTGSVTLMLVETTNIELKKKLILTAAENNLMACGSDGFADNPKIASAMEGTTVINIKLPGGFDINDEVKVKDHTTIVVTNLAAGLQRCAFATLRHGSHAFPETAESASVRCAE